jgi:predicted TIM-barrel fold metal-dependent hydrolase
MAKIMNIDMHYHLSGEPETLLLDIAPLGCVISRHLAENERCFHFASRRHCAVALFTDPSSQDWDRTLSLVKKRKALAYNHIENVGSTNIKLFDPVFSSSEEEGVPTILHLSRHDDKVLCRDEASKCLDYICTRFPRLQVIIAHLGGENFWTVREYVQASERMMLDTSCFRQTARRIGLKANEILKSVSTAISPKQILFGSDRTLSSDTQFSFDTHPFSKAFSDSELGNIFHNNARRVLDRMALL